MNKQQRQSRMPDPQVPSEPRLFALVLAAGRASRYGAVKQLARFRGTSLVARAMRVAEDICCGDSLLITGFEGHAVHAACAPLRGFLVHNESFDNGLGSSIACGAAAIPDAARGILILLADQPLVSAGHLEKLATCWRASPDCAVATRFADAVGVPAIFPSSDFAALRGLSGDRGAQPLLLAHGKALLTVDCDAAAVDIDCPADLRALESSDQA